MSLIQQERMRAASLGFLNLLNSSNTDAGHKKHQEENKMGDIVERGPFLPSFFYCLI